MVLNMFRHGPKVVNVFQKNAKMLRKNIKMFPKLLL